MSTEVSTLVQQAASLRRAGRLAEAVDAYQRLLARWPDLPESWYNLAWAQRQLGQFEAALESYEHALTRGVRAPEEVRLNRGVIFADHLHRPEAAEAEYKAALALNGGYWAAHFNLGNLYEDRGDRGAASYHYERVLDLSPNAWEALARLANLADISDAADPLIGRLEIALGRADVSPADKASLSFALGRALDAAGEYDRAFEAYTHANAWSRKPIEAAGVKPYDRAVEEALTDRIIKAFPAAAARGPSQRGKAPVFICGKFRSGSTLTEQVLAGHPRITAGGELDIIPRLVRTELAPFPESLASLDDGAFERLAVAYSERLARSFPDADLVSDKRPDNYLYIGLIKRLFPDAKIVHTTRNPLDNILSIYFLHLDQSMGYALDLMDAAHHYREYRRLMAHWRSLYPGDILEFDYDAFVREPRQNTEQLLSFLGLEWSEDCLAFHQRSNLVKTASVWQVRQPLYQRASGRWRNYARQLAGVQDFLGDMLTDD